MRDGRTVALLAGAGVALLAIGVVLGSGPLRAALLGDVGDEIDTLQAQIEVEAAARADAEAAAQAAVAYVDGAAPALLADRLAGAAVLIVTVPGADGDLAAGVANRIVQAGGQVAGEVALTDEWAATETTTFREALAEQLAPTVIGEAEGDVEALLAHAFVQGSTGGAAPSAADPAEVAAIGTDRGEVLWSLLVQAGLADGAAAQRADAVVMIGGSDAGTLGVLADAFAQYDAPVILAGSPGQTAPYAGSLDVATVAGDEWTMGSVTVAAVISESLFGAVPHYGPGEVPGILSASAVPTGTAG
ncbi:copper transporter [Demequina lignilytica]|uniref:Copper transporter n=1 Tax=Demequina lignilytica TaxID=3051663 RepID=A0AAW7M954_9MICO|nr:MULTISPECIES: copper transporter [unclassified Demequina]MDN4479093.1 copper transporter [Demequina sp. SYSU T00039-1]MDN4484394.1 copper transporter [Demequina sp. SYSU T0a273]MDN4488988.1 copper transporter [Demequina sp. SYSU T00039]MDN4491301.1 copper transporter [Demequina sp. SYSU T00068]